MNKRNLLRWLVGPACLTLVTAVFCAAEPPEDNDKKPPDKPLEGPKRPQRGKVKRGDRAGPGERARQGDGDEDRGPGEPGHRPRRPGPGGPDDEMGPPGGPDGPGGPGGPMRRLTKEQMDELMELMRDNFPNMYERAQKIKKNRPEQFERAMHQFAPPLMQILHADKNMKKVLVEDFKLEQDIRDLERKYRETDNADARKKIKAEMIEKLEKQFDVRQEKHRLIIEGIEKRLREQKQVHDQRNSNKKDIVQRRLQELTRDSDDMQFPE